MNIKQLVFNSITQQLHDIDQSLSRHWRVAAPSPSPQKCSQETKYREDMHIHSVRTTAPVLCTITLRQAEYKHVLECWLFDSNQNQQSNQSNTNDFILLQNFLRMDFFYKFTLTTPRWSIKIFSGFKSRCIIARAWQNSRPLTIW